MNRRWFIKAAAILALAPELCFGRKLDLPATTLPGSGLLQTTCYSSSGKADGKVVLIKQTPEGNAAWEAEWFEVLNLKREWIVWHCGNGCDIKLTKEDCPDGVL